MTPLDLVKWSAAIFLAVLLIGTAGLMAYGFAQAFKETWKANKDGR